MAAKTRRKTSFYSTYGWHPLAAAVALANLRWLKARRRRLLADVKELSDYFRERLAKMDFTELRIQGLAVAARARSARTAERIQEACLEQRLLLSAEDEWVTMFPPLTLGRALAQRGLDVLARCARRP